VGEGEDGRGGEEGVDSLGKLKTRIYHTGITVYFFLNTLFFFTLLLSLLALYRTLSMPSRYGSLVKG
jgi:hypothetical protein